MTLLYSKVVKNDGARIRVFGHTPKCVSVTVYAAAMDVRIPITVDEARALAAALIEAADEVDVKERAADFAQSEAE